MTSIPSDIIIHFGAQPTQGQEVAIELKEQNINLLRLSPSEVNWCGGPTLIQPNYSFYVRNLGPFIACAAGEINQITVLTSPFQVAPPVTDPLPLPFPKICVSFLYAVTYILPAFTNL
jgi:hypothetical protein